MTVCCKPWRQPDGTHRRTGNPATASGHAHPHSHTASRNEPRRAPAHSKRTLVHVHGSSSPRLGRALPRRTGLTLGVLACVLNLSFVMESLLPGPARVGATVVSDLSVPGRPWSWLFRVADAGSALCLLALCVLLLQYRSALRDRSRVAWVAAVVATAAFAASTVVAATVTETCAAATDPACPTGVAQASTADLVHDVVSSVGSTAGVVAALVFAVLLRRTRWLATLHGAAFAAAASSGVVFVAWQAQPQDDLSGWVQRAQIVALSLWFVVLGVTADRGPGGAASAREGRREKMRA